MPFGALEGETANLSGELANLFGKAHGSRFMHRSSIAFSVRRSSKSLFSSHGVSLVIPRCPDHNDSSVAMAHGNAAPD